MTLPPAPVSPPNRRRPFGLGPLFLLAEAMAIALLVGCSGTPIRKTEAASQPLPALVWNAFPGDHVQPPTGEALTILCTGDLMFGRHVEEVLAHLPSGDPFEAVRSDLTAADLAMGNLECVLGNAEARATWKGYDKILLPAAPDSAKLLKKAGYGFLTLDNNHSFDFGEAGFRSTVAALEAQGLGWHGAWNVADKFVEPWITQVRGVRVAVLTYSDVSPPSFDAKPGKIGTAPPMPSLLKRDIPHAKAESDLLIIQVHWGKEYTTEPTDRQVALAHLMVDLGADAVVGHHPHLLQAFERYKGKPILYSLGNFLFDLSRPETHPTIALKLVFKPGRATGASFAPVWGGDIFPRPIRGAEWDDFPEWLKKTMPVQAKPVPTPKP